MPIAVKPGYVNPLTMMGQKKTGLMPTYAQQKKSEKRQDVKDLQTQKQSLQNHILLLKSTTDGIAGTTESQEMLEQKLEEISLELKTAKSQESRTADIQPARDAFDRYEHVEEDTESYGFYEIRRD